MLSSINNFLTVSTKLAILLTHKHKTQGLWWVETVPMLGRIVKAQLRVENPYFLLMDNVETVTNKWSFGIAVLCWEGKFKYKKITAKKITFFFFPQKCNVPHSGIYYSTALGGFNANSRSDKIFYQSAKEWGFSSKLPSDFQAPCLIAKKLFQLLVFFHCVVSSAA